MTEQYRNRYGDVFTFVYDPEKDEILWRGNFEYARYSWDNNTTAADNRYIMVDPSGGPYISSGMEARFVMKGIEGRFVDYMSLNTDGAEKILSVNIHLKPLNP